MVPARVEQPVKGRVQIICGAAEYGEFGGHEEAEVDRVAERGAAKIREEQVSRVRRNALGLSRGSGVDRRGVGASRGGGKRALSRQRRRIKMLKRVRAEYNTRKLGVQRGARQQQKNKDRSTEHNGSS